MKQTSSTATEGSVRGHNVNIDRPEAKGGTDTGAMGGELLLMSLGGCFMSNLLEAVRTREGAISDIHIDVVGAYFLASTSIIFVSLQRIIVF